MWGFRVGCGCFHGFLCFEAGARFIQTQAVFDTIVFREWLDELKSQGITEKAAILAGIIPLSSYAEAKELADKHTDFYTPDSLMNRIKDAGDENAQKNAWWYRD